jgi:hypothetical protein
MLYLEVSLRSSLASFSLIIKNTFLIGLRSGEEASYYSITYTYTLRKAAIVNLAL